MPPWHRARLNLKPVQTWFPGKGSGWQGPNPGVFYSSKVRARLGWWKQAGASRLCIQVLKDGYKLAFNAMPTPLRAAPLMVSEEDIDFALKDIAEGDSCGAYGPLRPGGKDFLARMRVNTAAGKRRCVINLRHVNSFIRQKTCRYEGAADLPRIVRPNAWMFSWDAKRAFASIPLHLDTAHYLSFHFALPSHMMVDGSARQVPLLPGGYFVTAPDGSYYQVVERTCLALPFGMTMSPYVWAKVFKVLSRALRKAGIHVLIYVDDGLASLPSRAAALLARDLVQELFLRSGLTRAEEKGVWEPTQILPDHLGFSIDSRGQGFLSLPERRCSQIRTLAKDLLCRAARHSRWVPTALLREFLGKTSSANPAIRDARLQARALHNCTSLWSESSRLDREAQRALQFWTELHVGSPANGRPLWPAPASKHIYTDASGTLGYGCLVTNPSAAPPAAAFRQELASFGGYWTPDEIPFHITWKELAAVRKGIRECSAILAGQRVLLFEDNQAVVHMIRNRTSRSPALMAELRQLLKLLDELKIDLDVRYIRSALNPADALSRLTHRDAWGLKAKLQKSLKAEVERRLDAPLTLDPFACHRSHVVQRYCSRFGEPSAIADDGLQVPWGQERLWLNPPWALLPAVIHKLHTEPEASGVLIYPEWPSQLWYPELQALKGMHLPLPPTKYAVFAFHVRTVEPCLHPGLQLKACVFGPGINVPS